MFLACADRIPVHPVRIVTRQTFTRIQHNCIRVFIVSLLKIEFDLAAILNVPVTVVVVVD